MAKQRFGINDGYRGAVGTVIGYEWCGRWCLRSRPRKVSNPRTERQQQNRGLFAAASRLATAMGGVLRVGLITSAREQHRTVYNHFISVNTECFSLNEEQLTIDYERLVVSEGMVAPVGFSLGNTLLSQPQAAASSPNFAPLRSQAVSPSEPGRGEQPISNIAGSNGGSGTSPKLGEVAARRADGGVCQQRQSTQPANHNSITIPFERNPLHMRANSDDKVYLWAWCAERMEGCLSLPAYRRSRQVSIELPTSWEGQEVHLYGFVEDFAGRTSDSVYLGTVAEPTDQSEEISPTSYNKNGVSTLDLTYNNNEYETSISIGSYTGTCWNCLGTDPAESGSNTGDS